MSLAQELNDYYQKVCALRQGNNNKKSENILFREVVSLNESYDSAIFVVNNTCQYLKEAANDTVQGRSLTHGISVGKESAPLIVSLKQLSDNMYKADINGSDANTQETVQNSLSKAEDYLQSLEDICKSTSKFIQNLEYLIKNFKKQDKLERNLSTASEISSFLDKDVVTSSPIINHK